jgi:hypothetical protein
MKPYALRLVAAARCGAVAANILDRLRNASWARRCRWLAILAAVALVHPVAAQMLGASADQAGAGAKLIVLGGAGHNLFEARVPVDVTAATVTEARDRALTQGRIAALHAVLEHLAPLADLARLPALGTDQVIDMVQEFSVSNERSSAVRYLADLTVRFDPTAVRRLLREAQIPFTEVASRPLVLLPVFVAAAGQAPVLWEEANPWRDAWVRLRDPDNLVPLIVPAGGPEDAKLKVEQVLAKDPVALSDLAARYDAGGVVIAKATMSGSDPVQVALTAMRGVAPPVDLSITSPLTAGQSADDALSGAALAADQTVAEDWKQHNQIDIAVSNQITALIPVTSLKDWLRIKSSLANVPPIQHIDLQALTRDRVQVTFRYACDQPRLALALEQQNLTLSQQNGVWILALAGRAGAAE